MLSIRPYILAGIASVLVLAPLSAQNVSTTRVSLNWLGNQVSAPCKAPVTSEDGRYVAFQSTDPNLVPGDTNNVQDVFLRDTVLGTTIRVSVTSQGVEGNGLSSSASISADGRFVVYHSASTNLVPGDTNGFTDVFRYDRVLFTTTRVSLTQNGLQATGGDSLGGVISADGLYVAFRSEATNIPNNPDTNNASDIFRWDSTLGTVRRISVANNWGEPNRESIGPSISETGRYVAFYTLADNLSAPGFDTNNNYDVYVHDVFLGTTTLVSKSSAGVIGNGGSSQASVSQDGQYVAFKSDATNLVAFDSNGDDDVFRHDTLSGTTLRVSLSTAGAQGNGDSAAPSISADGRFIAFESGATNLVAGDTNAARDIFLRDVLLSQTVRSSVSTGGAQADRQCIDPAISPDGRFIVFESAATNLVAGDTNLAADIFKRDGGPRGVVLAKSGSCPGPVTFTASGATPSRLVAFAYGNAGSFTLAIPPCAGLVLNIANPTLAALITANTVGEAVLSLTAPPGACGLTLQAVDVATCEKSNAVVL